MSPVLAMLMAAWMVGAPPGTVMVVCALTRLARARMRTPATKDRFFMIQLLLECCAVRVEKQTSALGKTLESKRDCDVFRGPESNVRARSSIRRWQYAYVTTARRDTSILALGYRP